MTKNKSELNVECSFIPGMRCKSICVEYDSNINPTYCKHVPYEIIRLDMNEIKELKIADGRQIRFE